jgi:DNA-binding NarL/FixJ family response regulator
MKRNGTAQPRPAVTVLVVEGSPVLGERLNRLASDQPGVAAAVAVSLDHALTHLRTCSFDVLLVDVVDPTRWPDLKALRQLRIIAPHATLIALAADGEPETVEACRSLGADQIVPLDAGMSELTGLLADHIRRRRARSGDTGGRIER